MSCVMKAREDGDGSLNSDEKRWRVRGEEEDMRSHGDFEEPRSDHYAPTPPPPPPLSSSSPSLNQMVDPLINYV